MNEFKDFTISEEIQKKIKEQVEFDGIFSVEIPFKNYFVDIEGSGVVPTFREETGVFSEDMEIHDIEISVWADGEEIQVPEELEKYIHSQFPR